MISRDHAEITGVKTASGRIEKYQINDHSLNGTYINDTRCRNRVPTQIQEGDIIKFGHMNGASIKENEKAPQASAEFAFVVERAMPNYPYMGFRDGRRVHPIICRGEHLNCQEADQRTIDSREPVNTSLSVKSAVPPSLPSEGSVRPVQPVPPTAHLTAHHALSSSIPSSSSSSISHQMPSAATSAAAAAAASPLNFFPYASTNLASLYSYPANLFAVTPSNSITHWNLHQAQAAISGFRAPNVFGTPGLPPSTSASFLQRGFLPQASNALVNSLLNPVTPVTAAAVLASHQHQLQQQQQQHQQQLQQQHQQHQQQQHDAALAAVAAASVASLVSQHSSLVKAEPTLPTPPQQTPLRVPVADTTMPVKLEAQSPLTVKVEQAVTVAPATHPVKAAPIASPPMECDSSVPSPPKTAAADSSSSITAVPVVNKQETLLSPVKKEDDLRSERSFAESPPPRRAPAPAPWDSTPSPRPRDTPDRDSVKEREHQQVDKKEKKEWDDVKPDKKTPAPITKHRKTNEIARLLDDLTETSWANQVKRVSTNSRRPVEEVQLEKNAKKEKKKKDKERARREREETERKSALAVPPSSSSAVTVTNSMASSASRLMDAKRRLKQLSDEDSVSSSDSSEEGNDAGKRRLSTGTSAISSVAAGKKEALKRRKSSARSSDESSESSSDDGDSDDSTGKKKQKKRAKKASGSSKGKELAGRRRSSVGASKGKAGKVGKKASVSSYDEPEPAVLSAQATVDENGDPVTHHDPTSTCGLEKQCTRPQDEQVNWICCDDCDTWYHNICILGHEEAPTDSQFFCGCTKKPSSKPTKKLMKKKIR